VNRVRFTSCRQYLGETKLSFSDHKESGMASAGQPLRTVEIPAGLTLYLELETSVDSAVSAAGDSITFKLQRELKHGGQTLFEKGSLVHGRLTLLRRTRLRLAGYSVGLRLSEIQSPSGHATLSATIDEIPVLNNSSYRGPEQSRVMLSAEDLPKSVGSAFFQPGTSVILPRGTVMVWRTVPDSDHESKP
jgi:hypothetical protein